MTIKDSLDTADIITTGSMKGRASFVRSQDATVVRRVRAAGVIIMGKTNTPDLTLNYETSNLVKEAPTIRSTSAAHRAVRAAARR